MLQTTPSPAEISAANVAFDKANNPFYHSKRFEIQIHRGLDRQNVYLPTWQLVEMVLRSVKPEDRNAPELVIVSDNRDTYGRVLRWEKCWYGYETTLRRGAAVGEVPRGWAA